MNAIDIAGIHTAVLLRLTHFVGNLSPFGSVFGGLLPI